MSQSNSLTFLEQRLSDIESRTERNASLTSDDFGHDCQKLLLAESAALQVAADDISFLLAVVKVAREVLEGEL